MEEGGHNMDKVRSLTRLKDFTCLSSTLEFHGWMQSKRINIITIFEESLTILMTQRNRCMTRELLEVFLVWARHLQRVLQAFCNNCLVRPNCCITNCSCTWINARNAFDVIDFTRFVLFLLRTNFADWILWALIFILRIPNTEPIQQR